LREFGLPDKGIPNARDGQIQDVIAEVVAETVNEIVDELRRTMSYLTTLGSESVPDGVCLLGDAAAIRNLAPHLSEKTGVAVCNWELPGVQRDSVNNGCSCPALLGVAAALSSIAWES
jgi:actin-like ATPase involved in cell morphogenesis